MSLPKYHETFIPILAVLDTVGIVKSRILAQEVQKQYYANLPKDDLLQTTSTGKNTLYDRINWGKSYLKMGKFVSYPKRGHVQITEKGKQALAQGKLSLETLKKDVDYINYRAAVEANKGTSTAKKKNHTLQSSALQDSTPQDMIDGGFETLNAEVKTELLEILKNGDPYFLETVILKLLKKMGYGDYIETSKSADGGIDGIINEDKLGLEKIYTQVKCYTDTIIREKDIRNFIGAMSGDTQKGVFITTSTFDKKAIAKAREAHHSIILINGTRLVELMLEYNVGVQIKTTYEIKEIDHDFFEV